MTGAEGTKNRVVLLWFYFRPSYGGSSMRATILAEGLILPVKIVNAFDGFILGSNPSGGGATYSQTLWSTWRISPAIKRPKQLGAKIEVE